LQVLVLQLVCLPVVWEVEEAAVATAEEEVVVVEAVARRKALQSRTDGALDEHSTV
jgi:hypothetical protein